MQPREIAPQGGVVIGGIGEEAREHRVVIAAQHDPVRGAATQVVDDAAAVGAPVHEVAQMYDGRAAVAGVALVRRDARMGGAQQVKLAVDIADGIAAHGFGPV